MAHKIIAALVPLIVCIAPAQATTMLALDLASLSQRADRIVLARVESKSSRRSSLKGLIYTDVTLRVERSYKGSVGEGQSIIITHEGGSVDGIGMRVAGSPNFAVGEEVLAFVETRQHFSVIVGMAQGKLQVTARNGERFVRADLRGLELLGRPPVAGLRRLAEVEHEILALVHAP